MRSILKAIFFSIAVVSLLLVSSPGAFSQDANGTNVQTAAEQIVALANQARSENGAGRLRWDPALAAAALYHCRRMAAEGPISHRYGGEPDLSARASQAGAHFSVIEENVAVGPSAAVIHDEWMHSPGHRSNLLSPDVDRVGVAVVASRGVLYAVADYSREVQSLGAREVEAKVADLIRPSGVSILSDPSLARAACATDQGVPHASGAMPGFVMRWQDSELAQLPKSLAERLAEGRYHLAAVGSCPARGNQGSFTAYRVAVLLY
jgi:hypothetical protein